MVDIIREYQFGRIENLLVQSGQPVFNADFRMVRVARLGAGNIAPETPGAREFELKRPFLELFEQLARIKNGVLVRLEFKHGLPFMLETIAHGGPELP